MDPTPELYGPFLHLAGTLRFSATARALHMSPSALTRGIQRLEEQLGQQLFVRDKRNVVLTRAGELVRDHARAQVAAHRVLLETLAAEQQAPTGELRIACTVTACHSILPKLLAQSRARYPGLHLQISTSDATRCLQRLRDDEVDVAVLPVPDAPDTDLRVAPLAHTELSFIAPKSDKSLQQRAKAGGDAWNGLPMVLPRLGVERERIDAWLAARDLRPEIYAEVNGNEAILAMVSLGCGVGIVPELVREGSPLKRSVVRVNVPNPPRGYEVALCAKQRSLDRRAVSLFWSLQGASTQR